MPAYLTGTEKLSRTINLPQTGDYTAIWWVRPRSVPTGGNYFCFMALKNAAYTQYAGFFTQFGSLATNLEVNNNDGSGQHDTPQLVLSVGTWYTLAYVRSGTTHECRINGSLIGSVTVDTSGVVWDELLIGYDGFALNDFDTWGFRDYTSALSGSAFFSQMQRAVPNGVVQTDTPLLTDLLDRTANANDFIGPATPTFVAGPIDRRPVVHPTQMLTGVWMRYSACLGSTVPFTLHQLDINSGMTLSLAGGVPTGGRTIARVSVVWGGVSTGGLPGDIRYVSSHFSLQVEYLSASTFLLVVGAVVPDPWPDPVIGTSVTNPTVTWLDLTPHRVALAIRGSTKTGGVYGNDGEIRVYVDDAPIISLTGLHFADAHPFVPSPTLAVGYGCHLAIDRVWSRLDAGVPVTDADGHVLDTTDLWYQDDFAVAEVHPVAWGPYADLPAFPERYPFLVSDIGGNGTAGLSVSTASAATLVADSTPFLPSAIVRLMWDDILPTPPEPPVIPPPAACPVSLFPTAVIPPPACPVDLTP